MVSDKTPGIALTQELSLVPNKLTVTVVTAVTLGAVKTTGVPLKELKLPELVLHV